MAIHGVANFWTNLREMCDSWRFLAGLEEARMGESGGEKLEVQRSKAGYL